MPDRVAARRFAGLSMPAVIALAAGVTSGAFVDVTWTTTSVRPGVTTYRFFANFDDPADAVLGVSGSGADVPVAFSTDTILFQSEGEFPGLKQGDFAAFPIHGIDDSWVTIGATGFVGNDTDYTDGFLDNDGVFAVIVGSAWSDADDDGWFDSDPATPENGGAVTIAQFSVLDAPDGSPGAVRFSGGIDHVLGVGGVDRALFAVNTPGPGGIGVLALGLIARGRRRR